MYHAYLQLNSLVNLRNEDAENELDVTNNTSSVQCVVVRCSVL